MQYSAAWYSSEVWKDYLRGLIKSHFPAQSVPLWGPQLLKVIGLPKAFRGSELEIQKALQMGVTVSTISVADGSWHCRLPIFDLLPTAPIGNQKSKIKN